jgi:hypothetical protein
MLLQGIALSGAFLFAVAQVPAPSPMPAPSATPAAAATAAPSTGPAATIAVLPFGTPDKHSGYDDQATTILTDDLNAHGAVAVDSAAIDHNGAFDAKAVCAATGVKQIIAGRLKVDETTRMSGGGRLLAAFVPFGGALANSGAMNHTNTRVHLAVQIFDCDDTMQWENKDVYGDASKDGTNAPAAVTAALHVAIDKVLVVLPTGIVTSLPTPTPSPTPSPEASP